MVAAAGMQHVDRENLMEKLREIEQQARLVLDEMIATPSIHRTRLLHIVALAQQLQASLEA